MLFSVIVAVYNLEKYVRECIESVLTQTCPDFELIIVDDGSKDSSPEICDEYAKKDARIRVVHKKNGGLVSARKAGISLAQGEYIVNLDGDDCIEPTLLEKVQTALKNSKADIVCYDYSVYTDGKKIPQTLYNLTERYYDREALQNELFSRLITAKNGERFAPLIWNKAFKRELLFPIQMDLPDYVIMGEDSCISYVCIYRAKSMCVIADRLYNYRTTENSITHQRKKALSWDEPLWRAQFYAKYIPLGEGDFRAQVARITVHSLYNVAFSVFKVKKYKEAKKEIKEQLSRTEYAEYLKEAKFKGNFKEKAVAFCLRKRFLFPIFLFSKIAK
jgi:glycosyltransferase involved in cell wall biosynthesis